ncbi:SAM-dependent methyltransferase [Azospirillum fermentarium]|uniref:class I SAM-dependent methyltransferase n=1 Tax=Azospirillum fermentarium TaxID=1233114 RepID=UPI002227E727|nr:methyltransferase domain-containing protein [Azospirillum fermentarium]MCW2245012.1 SAM-dependent methyltransferase [Azospirillum fermentarium]
MSGYVHGYSGREAERLADQAAILEALIHDGLSFPPGTHVLEAGCGTGRQTAALLARHPGIRITALDIDAGQLAAARAACPGPRVTWIHGDLRTAPLADAGFDHGFVCFVLEHLADPAAALGVLRRAVRPGGRVTVVEGDHGSFRTVPETAAGRAAWDALVAAQRRLGGNPDIGRRLHGLLTAAGFSDVRVEPRTVFADAGAPALRDGFTRRIIVPMVAGAVDGAAHAQGLADLAAASSGPDGVTTYTFYRAVGRVPE